jgi:5'-nucleotidase
VCGVEGGSCSAIRSGYKASNTAFAKAAGGTGRARLAEALDTERVVNRSHREDGRLKWRQVGCARQSVAFRVPDNSCALHLSQNTRFIFSSSAIRRNAWSLTVGLGSDIHSKNSFPTFTHAAAMNEICELLRSQPLRIGISTGALFDLEEEHLVFVSQGVQAYSMLQLQRENTLIAKGPGFEVVERLLRLNEPNRKPYVEVFLLSRNSPDLSLRAFNSIAEYGLGIKAGSFTSGRSLGPFISAWDVDLFLSNEVVDVQAAVSAGAAAAKLGVAPQDRLEIPGDEVRIAFDGDAVVFSAESDEIYKERGLAAFLQHEQENAKTPMAGGPFGKFLKKLSILRRIYMNDEGVSRVRIAIVTARNALHMLGSYTL